MPNVRITDTVEISREAYDRLNSRNRELEEDKISLQRRVRVLELQLDAVRSPQYPEFLTTDQAADILQLSKAQIQDYIRKRELPAIQLSEKGNWRIPYKVFVQFLSKHLMGEMETSII